MALTIITPMLCLKRQIESNEKLAPIIEEITSALYEEFQIGKSLKVQIEASEVLSWDEQALIKDWFKRNGWKTSITKNGDKYTFVMSESNN